MLRMPLSLLTPIVLLFFGMISAGRSYGSEISRALKCFEIKVSASDEKDRPAVNTINGSGMIGDLCDNRWENTWAATVNTNNPNNPHPGTAKGSAWIEFDFDRVQNITQMWVWNYNEGTRRGLRNVTIEYTVDGHAWKKLGDYVFGQAPGTTNYTHNTTVDFKGVAAKSVVITAKEGSNIGNYGDPSMYGLSEIRFYVSDKSDHNKPIYAKWIAPHAKPRLKLERGITIDRQIHSMPSGPSTVINRDDIHLIKSMSFEFVKYVINPAIFKSGDGINPDSMWYLDRIINFAVEEKLPVVVCIHPENEFKNEYLQNETRFESLLGFYRELTDYMAKRWNPDQLAFQLMTEPFGTSSNSDDWNYWDKLQHRIWKAVRQKMPEHTLILSGDMTGQIEGFYDITPVKDANVMYSFTFYEPHLFTFQGGPWQSGGIPYLKNLPYPSSHEILDSMSSFLSPVPEQFRNGLKNEIEQYANESWNQERLKDRIKRLAEWNQYYGKGRLKIWCAEFGCYQGGANLPDRLRYINDIRTIFDAEKIGWSYWSYNETFSVMTSDRTPSGPAYEQTPDKELLRVLMPDTKQYGKQ